MIPTHKDAETIIGEFELDSLLHSKGRCGFNVTAICSEEEQAVKLYIRSSLASILLEAERKMPEKWCQGKTDGSHPFECNCSGYNQSIDECRAVLREMVEEIIKE